MSQERYKELKQTGMIKPDPHNPHNDATSDLETAKYYSSTRVHEDPGVVVKFRAPREHVREDEVFKGDYKMLRPVSAADHEVVHGVPVDNSFCATGVGGGVDPTCSPEHGSSVTPVSKYTGQRVGRPEKLHADGIEREVAAGIKGEWEPDDKFYDAKTKDDMHFVEVKSLLKGKKNALSMHADAVVRKIDGMATQHPDAVYHTVAVDDRQNYEGGIHADKFSGNRMYYKRGAGRYSLSMMHQVRSMAELRRLMKMKDEDLPEAARGALPSGRAVIAKLRRQAEDYHQYRIMGNRKRRAEGRI
jgi:hypothetical protein